MTQFARVGRGTPRRWSTRSGWNLGRQGALVLGGLVGGLLAGERHAAASGVAWHQATLATFGWGMFEPSVSVDGRFVAFRSAFDFVGENLDVNFEIFLYDRDTQLISQVTHTSSLFGNFEPKITPQGDAIIFRSLYNFVGANADGSFELFEYTVATGAFKQLTSTPGSATVSSAKLSADGSTVVFLSNFDGTNDVMRYRRATGALLGVTNLPPGCVVSNPTVNADGTIVAFRSNHNIGGLNPDFSFEIFRWVEGAGTMPVSNVPQLNESPSIDGSGRFIAFLSRANFVGGNPGFNREIFIADTERGGFTQVTPSFNIGKHLEPVFSPDGSFVAFESERDPIGLNPDKNRELFRYVVATATLVQETQTIGGASINGLSDPAAINYVAISGDGAHLAYRNEHLLDPRSDDPAPEVNLEVFVAAIAVPPAPVFGDLNGDGLVGEADLAICLGAWGTNSPIADLDENGNVDVVDLSLLLGAWS